MTHTEESLMALADQFYLSEDENDRLTKRAVLCHAIREVLAENKRVADDLYFQCCITKELLPYQERAVKAEAECERFRKDAERYRWLRKYGPNSMAIIAYRSPSACRVEPQDYATFEEYTDAAIDAALKDQP